MRIVTGYTGKAHIMASDDQGRNRGTFGSGCYILNTGLKFAAQLSDATTIEIFNGEGMLQGVHFRIDTFSSDTVNIAPGTEGYNRIDLICARYTNDMQTGVEDVELVVLQGTPTTGVPVEPEYDAGDVALGTSQATMPLYKVTLSGVSPTLTRVAKIEGIHRSTLLWESAATTGSTLSIDLDLSEYDYIDVEYWYSASSGFAPAVQRHPVGKTTKAMAIGMGTAISMFTRDVVVSQNNVTFGAISYGRYYEGAWSLGAETMQLLPVKIYGVAY